MVRGVLATDLGAILELALIRLAQDRVERLQLINTQSQSRNHHFDDALHALDRIGPKY